LRWLRRAIAVPAVARKNATTVVDFTLGEFTIQLHIRNVQITDVSDVKKSKILSELNCQSKNYQFFNN